jgi:hypothetical protein
MLSDWYETISIEVETFQEIVLTAVAMATMTFYVSI